MITPIPYVQRRANPVKLITPSVLECVTLTEAKDHLKVTDSNEDSLIQTYLNAAVKRCENYRQSNIMSAEYEIYLSTFSYSVNLQKSPVTAINSVKYYDDDNALATVDSSNYRLQDFRTPARLEFDSNFSFPSYYYREFPVVINYQAGFTYSASASYAVIKHAILSELGTMNEIRQTEMTGMGLSAVQMKSVSIDILDSESIWL